MPCPLGLLLGVLGTRFEVVTWREGSNGMMTSCFALLEVRPSAAAPR